MHRMDTKVLLCLSALILCLASCILSYDRSKVFGTSFRMLGTLKEKVSWKNGNRCAWVQICLGSCTFLQFAGEKSALLRVIGREVSWPYTSIWILQNAMACSVFTVPTVHWCGWHSSKLAASRFSSVSEHLHGRDYVLIPAPYSCSVSSGQMWALWRCRVSAQCGRLGGTEIRVAHLYVCILK